MTERCGCGVPVIHVCAATAYYHLQFSNMTPENVTKGFAAAMMGSVAQFSSPPGTPDTWFVNWQVGRCPSTRGALIVAQQPNKFPDEANGTVRLVHVASWLCVCQHGVRMCVPVVASLVRTVC